MTVYFSDLKSGYELEQLCRIFFPESNAATVRISEDTVMEGTYAAVTRIGDKIKGVLSADGKILRSESSIDLSRLDSLREGDGKTGSLEIEFGAVLYELLVKHTGFTPPWGLLTGVRPIKLLRALSKDMGETQAAQYMKNKLRVSEEKVELSVRTLRNENPILELSRPNSFSLYVGIPFCPTRCSYCSFVSQSVEKSAKLLPEYVELLVKEIDLTANEAKKLGLRLESVYIGGGTPTTLSAAQMERVLTAISSSFDLSTCREFTVEAGRADTITREKLEVIKRCEVGRISINPQTMSDEILERIGRRHTVAQVLEAYELARELGFNDINMDLIAGLEGDLPEGFERTMQRVLELKPEEVTVHTLAMKRAARLVSEGEGVYSAEGRDCARMLLTGQGMLTSAGYEPYYLYRQARMLGNLENVGWSKRGHEGLYNVYIMDETHTILACGAGAVTKLRQPGVNYIERIFNYKFPYEYVSRFEGVAQRKRGISEFYEKFC